MPRGVKTLANKIVKKVKEDVAKKVEKEVKHELAGKVLHLEPYRARGVRRRRGGVLPLLPMGAAALAGWLLPKLTGGDSGLHMTPHAGKSLLTNAFLLNRH